MNTIRPAGNLGLGEGIFFEAEIPLSWEPLFEPPSETRLVGLNRANLGALQAMQFIDEYFPAEVEGSDQLDPDLARIEFKLNLLMDLFGRWLQANSMSPDSKWMRMNSQGVEWRSAEEAEIGSFGILSLYPEPKYPGAFQVYCQVIDRSVAEGGVSHTLVKFEGVASKVQNWIEKLVFRNHRRSIAYHKQQTSGICARG